MARNQRDQIRGATGKLKAAVRHWLGSGGDSRDDTDEALAAFGLQRDAAPILEPEPFKVYAINWTTLNLFWSTWKQWRTVVLHDRAVRDSMDWMQVEAALNLSGIKRAQWPLIFEGLQAMEQQALECLNAD